MLTSHRAGLEVELEGREQVVGRLLAHRRVGEDSNSFTTTPVAVAGASTLMTIAFTLGEPGPSSSTSAEESIPCTGSAMAAHGSRRTAEDRLDRQAQAPGHPRAIVWLRLAAWDS